MLLCLKGVVRARRRQGLARRCTLAVLLAAAALFPTGAAADDGDAVAIVNGHPLSREELVDILIDARGVEVLQQMIILQVAKQETRRRGIRVTQADVTVEFQTSLDRVAAEAGLAGEQATDENKREALKAVLDERGVSMSEFMIGMERNAHLRKLVEKDLRVTEETLREEFARTYGEKVLVRHIQLDRRDNAGLNQATELIRRGSDFGEIARRLSKNPQTAPRGGEMEPFTFDDPDFPAALREIAFSLEPGEVSSPVLAGQFFHILKLERRIPPRNARFEDVRDEVEQNLRERAIPQAMAQLAVELYKQAKIKVVDSKLRPKYEQYLREASPETLRP